MHPSSVAPAQFRRNWRTLRLFNIFRLVVAATLFSLAIFSSDSQSSQNNHLFQAVSLLFLFFSMFGSVAITKHWPRYGTQAYIYAVVDIIVFTMLTHALHSSDGSLEILLIITIVGTALLLPERGAIIIASLATLALLGERTITQLFLQIQVNYTQAGLLGATFFATALLSTALNRRLKESELLAEQRGVDLANMAQLNEHVIQLLQSGILVIDKELRIRLINQAATQLLTSNGNDEPPKQLPHELHPSYNEWYISQQQPQDIIFLPQNGKEISVHYTQLGTQLDQGTIIFLEDSSTLSQQVQHLKLASLGRLSASIAHEIRNPLGAISHAAQLLAESPELVPSDLRLIEIISNHSSRVNTIIESILQLSRRDRFNPASINLKQWLNEYTGELADSNHIERAAITVSMPNSSSDIIFDPTHLYQVINNLCNNGIRHSRDYPHNPKLEIHCGNTTDGRTYIEVADHGPGISEEDATHIFEPFYTTESSGTGLGLYIARELCECNHAKLDFIPSQNGACFRIIFNNAETIKQLI